MEPGGGIFRSKLSPNIQKGGQPECILEKRTHYKNAGKGGMDLMEEEVPGKTSSNGGNRSEAVHTGLHLFGSLRMGGEGPEVLGGLNDMAWNSVSRRK